MIFAALNWAQQATAAAEREAECQARLMNAIVENIPVGVCLFDGDLSLVAFNSEYAKLLDTPRSLLESGATFQDLVRFNAERGAYGARQIASASRRARVGPSVSSSVVVVSYKKKLTRIRAIKSSCKH